MKYSISLSRYSRIMSLVGLALYSGCSTEVPNLEGPDTPVFTLIGDVGTQPYILSGGVDNYYMFTNASTQTYPNGQSLRRFIGAFAVANCPTLDCPNTLSFELVLPDSMLLPTTGLFEYQLAAESSQVVYRGRFSPNSVGNASYLWDNGGQPVENTSPQGISVVSLESNRMLGLRTSTSQYESNAYHYVEMSDPTQDLGVQITYRVSGDTTFLSALPLQPGGQFAEFEYFWSNGAVTPSQTVVSPTLTSEYSVTITSVQDDRQAHASLTRTATSPEVIQSNHFQSVTKAILAELQDGIVVQWVDESGRIWRSDQDEQRGNQKFVVGAVEPFQENEDGLPTLRIQIVFECDLMYVSGGATLPALNRIPIIGTGWIGVAIP
jgi:hypothetical protein